MDNERERFFNNEGEAVFSWCTIEERTAAKMVKLLDVEQSLSSFCASWHDITLRSVDRHAQDAFHDLRRTWLWRRQV